MTIPIIGEPPARIIHVYPVVYVECFCQKGTGRVSMVVIGGIGGYVACGNCGKQYAIKEFVSNGKGGLDAVLDVLIPMEGAGSVQ